jgi:hypothetical protein
MNVKFYDLTNPVFVGIMWRLAIDLISLFILIRVIYYRYSRKEKFLFSFFLMGVLTFFIASVLNTVFLEMAGAFGLFAVLGILRMRTRNFSVKDMSYTFATLGISVINALNVLNFPLFGILVINFVILITAYILEQFLLRHRSETLSIVYENLELLRPEKKLKLLKDVSALTGKEVLKVKIRKIDYKRKTAILDLICTGLPD